MHKVDSIHGPIAIAFRTSFLCLDLLNLRLERARTGATFVPPLPPAAATMAAEKSKAQKAAAASGGKGKKKVIATPPLPPLPLPPVFRCRPRIPPRAPPASERGHRRERARRGQGAELELSCHSALARPGLLPAR